MTATATRRARTLEEDIQSALLLGAMIVHWKMPEARRVYDRHDETPCIDVYSFPGGKKAKVNRLCTVGLSSVLRERKRKERFELLFVLPTDFGGATFAEAADYLKDVAVGALNHPEQFIPGFTLSECDMAPTEWEAKALLVDEPYGEPEEMEELPGLDGPVKLLWIVPIYQSECDSIAQTGMAAFEAGMEQADASPADPSRPPYVS